MLSSRKGITRMQATVLVVIVVVAIVAAGSYAAFMPQQTATPTTTANPTTMATTAPTTALPPIKIGVIGPMSGPNAKGGEDFMEAAALAANEINAQGGLLGRQVVLVSGDDESKPEVGVSMIERIITVDKVNVIVGMFHSSVTLAQMEILAKYKVPTLNVFSESTEIGKKVMSDPVKYGYFWKSETNTTSSMLTMLSMLKYLLDNGMVKRNTGKFAVALEDSEWGRGIYEDLVNLLPVSGVPLSISTAQFIPIGTTDFYSILTKLGADKPDLYMANLPSVSDSVAFMKQYRELGIKKFILGASFLNDPAFYSLTGGGGEGVVDCGSASANVTDVGKHFTNAFFQKYGMWPDSGNAAEYDGMQIMFQAIQRAGSLDPVAINAELAKTKYTGVQLGNIVFSPLTHEAVFWNGVYGKARICWQLQEGGTIHVIWPAQFAEAPVEVNWAMQDVVSADTI